MEDATYDLYLYFVLLDNSHGEYVGRFEARLQQDNPRRRRTSDIHPLLLSLSSLFQPYSRLPRSKMRSFDFLVF